MKITYLYHSGFAVETENHFLIFDYWRDTPKGGGLADGVINPSEISDKDVLAFVSHRHADHYGKAVLAFGERIKKYRLILSDDIKPKEDALMVGPDETLVRDDFTLKTLKSTDEGVAFLLEIDGKTIYHAGDLNWWHWEGEPGSWNEDVKRDYITEISKLKGLDMDVAFVPVDPRLGEQYALGITALMRTVNIKHAVPMHFGDEPQIIERLAADPAFAEYRERLLPLRTRGESAEI